MAKRAVVDIPKPPEVVFEKLCDCHFVATHLHEAHKVEVLSSQNHGQGAKWIQHTEAIDDPIVATHEIIEAIPNSRVVMTSLDGLSSETFTFTLVSEGPITKLIFTNEIEGKRFFVRSASALFGWIIRKMMQKDLDRFRDALIGLV